MYNVTIGNPSLYEEIWNISAFELSNYTVCKWHIFLIHFSVDKVDDCNAMGISM